MREENEISKQEECEGSLKNSFGLWNDIPQSGDGGDWEMETN